MSYFKIKSYAKINLALNIVGKSKLLHRIESLISFVDLHDEIKIKKIDSKKHKIRFTGKFSDGIKSKNTISELLKNIDKRGLLRNHYQILMKILNNMETMDETKDGNHGIWYFILMCKSH